MFKKNILIAKTRYSVPVCDPVLIWAALVGWVGHYRNELTASVFINVHIIRGSPAKLATPIGIFLDCGLIPICPA